MAKEPTIITVRGVDQDLWIKFKMLCLKERKTAGAKLNEVIKGLVK
jgi:hypothetical protein